MTDPTIPATSAGDDREPHLDHVRHLVARACICGGAMARLVTA